MDTETDEEILEEAAWICTHPWVRRINQIPTCLHCGEDLSDNRNQRGKRGMDGAAAGQ